MDIQATKLELIKTILETENSGFIQRVSEFIKQEETDFWDDLSIEQRKEIEKASLEIENGEVVDYDSFMRKHR